MCDRKYLNKLRHCAKYLGKSVPMQSNSKNLSSVQKRFFRVNYNFIIVMLKQKYLLLLTVLSQVIFLIFLKKMLPYTSRNKGGYVYDIIVLKSGRYSVINLLRLFLSVKQLNIKMWNFYATLMLRPVIFFTHSDLFLYSIFSTSVTTSYQVKSTIKVFKKKSNIYTI